MVPLPEQDRRRWDAARIAEGTALVERALRRGRPGPYAVQAAIAALHAAAPTFEATDWLQIAALYGELMRRAPSPVVAVNAELLRRARRRDEADAAYSRAIACTANDAQRAELERRRAALGEPDPAPVT